MEVVQVRTPMNAFELSDWFALATQVPGASKVLWSISLFHPEASS
jgi:hypothetical protein